MAKPMAMDGFPEVVVCPVCFGALQPRLSTASRADPGAESGRNWFRCQDCGRYYPVVDSIPVLLASRSTLEPPAS